jgi:hypothetical protein
MAQQRGRSIQTWVWLDAIFGPLALLLVAALPPGKRPRPRHNTGGAMTERKPPETSWETWIDTQIRVATEEGAFDKLPGAGKPLRGFGQPYDPLWWQKQLVQREQITVLPPSLELLCKVEEELATIEKLHDEATAQRRDRQGQRDGDGGTADAPRHAGRRSDRGAAGAVPLSKFPVALTGSAISAMR